MKYAVEMGSVAMMYVPSFIKIGYGIRKLKSWGFTDTETARRLYSCLCVCESPLLTFESLNQILLNLISITWHLIPSQRRNS
jgi:hypothetical protein